jgi:hypothetical protein
VDREKGKGEKESSKKRGKDNPLEWEERGMGMAWRDKTDFTAETDTGKM